MGARRRKPIQAGVSTAVIVVFGGTLTLIKLQGQRGVRMPFLRWFRFQNLLLYCDLCSLGFLLSCSRCFYASKYRDEHNKKKTSKTEKQQRTTRRGEKIEEKRREK